MAAFSPAFSPTGFFAGVVVDPTTGLTRIISEAVGTFLEAQLNRASVEVIEASDATKLTRIAAEVVQEFPATLVPLTRAVVEVVQQDAFAPPSITAEVQRVVAEVLGYAAEYLGKHAVLTRAVLEVITSTVLRHRGFGLPDVAVDAVTIAYSIDLELTQPGFWGLQGASGDGYSLTWASASPSTITETWRNGATVVTNTFAAPSGRLVRRFTAPTAAAGVQFVDLASLRPDDRAGSGVLQELMVWDRQLTTAEATRIDAYLTCKWVTVACSPQITAPFPACVS